MDSPAYRYGFQGQEKDDELKGEGNSLNYTFRMHDPRVGRFFAVDPLFRDYPHYSPYSFSGNKLIAFVELEGKEEIRYFNAQRAQYKKLDAALTILVKSGLMKKLADEFASNNKLTDAYINYKPLGTANGKTVELYNEVYGDYKQSDLLYDDDLMNLFSSNNKNYQAEHDYVKQNTLEKGQMPIFIQISESNLEDNTTSVESIALTIYHELKIHAMDEKDLIDNTPTGQEHRNFYKDDKYYNKTNDQYSPAYKDILPNSPAGEIKAIIEKTSKEIKSQKTDEENK